MTSPSEERCIIKPDIDVIGVGIRASIYALSLLAHISATAFQSPELTAAIQASLGLTGLALFLTTVIATARNTLGLFHVLCVFHLLSIAGFAVRPRGRYPTSLTRTYAFTVLYVLVAASSLIFFIYVFATAPTFGGRADCNSRTVYILFGVGLQVTSAALRWAIVVVLGVLFLILCLWALFLGYISLNAKLDRGNRVSIARQDSDRGGGKTGLYEMVGCVACIVYLIIMTELMIKKNALADGVNSWAFGQVLAVMMLIGPLIEFASLLLGIAGRAEMATLM